ncbi:cellulose-binding domain protein : Cellulose-binding domain protein OS=Laribacter hongkongensis (strain HLHK9) GN=LHK_00825 PE=4 SV=1: PA14: PKD: Lectin_legB [Gemmataceae bacterium]|nr:cellulose-binding domain protein : Cellulose-binding domain protein OS=Laribacter hongkongensis (strain HLHK9) GN=LHK_00825 PE=4 SV=1: PA14: PKD: Lectin_legB [Gemmataceae bacterium]VTT99044.1 cellulose-binding domain protein : Cellulose-binding domain protein OS=Laribacter hongkongensis (strain HLHK9) GN=LHK_00825 PE=4 SV=1: PA14: PKD: Lectin_legB [Gemmataceae bacterium]
MAGSLTRWIASLFQPIRPIRKNARVLSCEQLECREMPAFVGTGTGLVANYFSDANFTTLAATRTNATIDFNWGTAAPVAGLPTDGFSARWTGQVQAQTTETYTFTVAADEGVRLWVGVKLVIDSAASTTAGAWSGTAALKAGQAYDLKLEYVDRSGTSNVQLAWASPSTVKQVVPATQLYATRGWLDTDIGTPAASGSLAAANGSYTVRGSGSLGGTADAGHFAYQSVTKDGNVAARITSLSGGTGGVMLRAGTGASDAFAAVTIVPGQGAVFTARTATGGAATSSAAVPAGTQPWVKLVRNGNLVSGYVSETGAEGSWRLVGTAGVALPRVALGGLVAGSAAGVATATFSNVTAASTVPVGANIDFLTDWSLANAFVDVVKQARGFTSLATNQPARTDAAGWPTEDFYTILQSGFTNTAKVYNGVYKLSFTGRADVSLWAGGGTVTNVVYDAAANRTTADVTVQRSDAETGWYFGLNFRNVGAGVRDVKVIRPGYDPNTTQVFTNEFLKTVQPFTTLRTMDFTQTNNNAVVNWADRTRATEPTQTSARGVAWEYVIALANATGKDVWINVPVGATDDYVRQLAALFKAQLNPDRAVYVEFSNEVWNGTFSQTDVNLRAALAEVARGGSNLANPGETAAANQWDWAFRRIARRIVEISNTFASVWGPDAIDTRVRPVLATQVAVPYILRTQLEYLDRTYGDPTRFLYGTAGAPYFAVGDADHTQTNLTVDQILAGFTSSIAANAAALDETAALATYYGLANLAYEGGPDTFGGNNIAAKKAASLDPRMKDITVEYMNDWYARGGDLFTWYMASPTNYDTQYGTWGLTNDITNLAAPKYAGVQQVIAAPEAAETVGTPVSGEVLAKNAVGNGATADAYPRYLHNGDTREYLVRVPQAGTYTLRVRYAAAEAGGRIQFLVNDADAGTLALPVTGPNYDSLWSPNDFADSAAVTVRLEAGLNVVRVRIVSEGYTLYSLKFDGAAGGVVAPPVSPVSPPVVPPTVPPVSPPVTAPPPAGGTGAVSVAAPTTVAGLTAALTATADDDGTATYTWWAVSGPGSVSFTYSGSNAGKNTTATFSAAGTYVLTVRVEDATGQTCSSQVTVSVGQTPTLTTIRRNGSAALAGTSLRLANGLNKAGSAFSATKVRIAKFNTSFQFRLTGTGSNGFTFAMQGQGATALGTAAGLGYAGVAPAVAVRFDAANGRLTVNSNGTVLGQVNLKTAGLDLRSGHVFRSQVSYNGSALTVTLRDATTGRSVVLRVNVNVAAIVGGPSAFIGFTGGTGKTNGVVDVLSWAYTPVA